MFLAFKNIVLRIRPRTSKTILVSCFILFFNSAVPATQKLSCNNTFILANQLAYLTNVLMYFSN